MRVRANLQFRDLLYGEISLPWYMEEFIRLPEFLRLRNVRLSNTDSVEFKDFGRVSRWEHGIAASYLAGLAAESAGLGDRDRAELHIAGLLHDVATPPFAHTAEFVLDGFDHAAETLRLFVGSNSEATRHQMPVFAGQPSRFVETCRVVSKKLGLPLDPEAIAEMIVGNRERGHLIAGFVDVDNLDNVTRASALMGFDVDPTVPLKVAALLGRTERPITSDDDIVDAALIDWAGYRDRLYGAFFQAGRGEIERQAWLQTLMRRALDLGFPVPRLVWNTDEGVLRDFEGLFEDDPPARRALLNYRLLHPSVCLAEVAIEDSDLARSLGRPGVAAWLERLLSGPDGLVSVLATRRRVEIPELLIQPPKGFFRVFAFDGASKEFCLRRLEMLSESGIAVERRSSPRATLHDGLGQLALSGTLGELARSSRSSVVGALETVTDWSFVRERNKSFIPYPATWVHAIPANLISALELRGKRIADPFSGTGQTAIEGMRAGCEVVAIDVNSVGCLVARARTSFLDVEARKELHALSGRVRGRLHLADFDAELLQAAEIARWFHPSTVSELACIREDCRSLQQPSKDFALATFAGILNSCSSRRGMGHGHFADNTPRSKNSNPPEYVDACNVFADRLQRNLRWYEGLLAQLARVNLNVKEAFDAISVIHGDSIGGSALGDNGPYDAIVTSPPYLGVIDYAMGQRLPYYWLFPDEMSADVEMEIGRRRSRNNKDAAPRYFDAMGLFAGSAFRSVKPGGYLAVVLGNSTARSLRDLDVTQQTLDGFANAGFETLWSSERAISGHRLHNLHRLTSEQIVVFQRTKSVDDSRAIDGHVPRRHLSSERGAG